MVKNFAMFSDAGNMAVQSIVMAGQEHNWTWFKTLEAMRKLSQIEEFAEAMDTAVREEVYVAMGFSDSFYI